ncbi:MAG: hypothetical protein PHN88_09130 [Ignavibacteria bacterium]|nr:hypothetical protein [Ignavibacteria bacterium]
MKLGKLKNKLNKYKDNNLEVLISDLGSYIEPYPNLSQAKKYIDSAEFDDDLQEDFVYEKVLLLNKK